MMSKAKLLIQNTSEQQDNHYSWGSLLDEIVSANATLKSLIPVIASGIPPSISLQGCYEKQKDMSKCTLTHKSIKQYKIVLKHFENYEE